MEEGHEVSLRVCHRTCIGHKHVGKIELLGLKKGTHTVKRGQHHGRGLLLFSRDIRKDRVCGIELNAN